MIEPPSDDEFRAAAVGYWEGIRNKSADDANAATAHGDEIVQIWREHCVAEDRLRILLRDDSDEVRYAAAAHLGRDDSDAVGALRELTANPRGLVAPTARLLLMKWTTEGA